MADQQDGAQHAKDRALSTSRWKRFFRRCLYLLIAFSLLGVIGYQITGRMYAGPQTLADVVNTMPHVPLFPLIEIAPDNRQAQRALAIPLLLIRWQGATRTEAVQLRAPADADFIQEWYQRVAPSQGWAYMGSETMRMGTRVLYLRRNEGLQVLVGHTAANIYTPVQFIYLQGLTAEQVKEFATTLPHPALGVARNQKPLPKIAGPVQATPTVADATKRATIDGAQKPKRRTHRQQPQRPRVADEEQLSPRNAVTDRPNAAPNTATNSKRQQPQPLRPPTDALQGKPEYAKPHLSKPTPDTPDTTEPLVTPDTP